MVHNRNFGRSKITFHNRTFGRSKITAHKRNFGLPKWTLVQIYKKNFVNLDDLYT